MQLTRTVREGTAWVYMLSVKIFVSKRK